MNVFLSSEQITTVTGALSKLYDTYAVTPFTVNKEPIQNIVNSNTNELPGYSSTSANLTDITFTPVFKMFTGWAIYPKKQSDQGKFIIDAKIILQQNMTYLKCKQDAYDYIFNGHTENILMNNIIYNVLFSVQIQNVMGLKFYYIELKETT